MIRKTFHYSLKVSKRCLETLAVLLTIIILSATLLLWRLTEGPIHVGFARAYIERALADPDTGTHVWFADVVLEWPQLRGPLVLDVRDLHLMRGTRPILSIGQTEIGLSGIHLLAGQIAPTSFNLSRPALHLVRDSDGTIGLSLESGAPGPVPPTQPAQQDNPFMQVINTLSRPPAAMLSRPSPLDHLRSFEIQNAQLIVDDHVQNTTWSLDHLNLSFERDSHGLAVTGGVSLPGLSGGISSLQADAIYNQAAHDFEANLHFQNFDPRLISQKIGGLSVLDGQNVYLSGDATAVIDTNFQVHKATLAVLAPGGSLTIPGVYAAPLAFQSLGLTATYDADGGALNIEKLQLRAQDVTLTLAGKLAVGADGISGPLTVTAPRIAQTSLPPLWPDVLRGGAIETWLLHRLSAGDIKNVQASFGLSVARQPDKSWGATVENAQADFDIANMTVDYRAPLTPAKNVQAHGHFGGNTLDIDIASAAVADMKVTKGRVTIDHVGSLGTAAISLHLDGTLPSLFAYISAPPINMDGAKIGMDIAHIRGTDNLDISVSFPTLKNLPADQVKVSVSGPLTDVTLPGVLHDMTLTSHALNLSVTDGMVTLKGPGKLDGRDLIFQWQQYLNLDGKPWHSQITATARSDDDFRDRLHLGLTDWVKGPMPVDVTYTQFAGGKSEATVVGDAGPATLLVTPLGYNKPPGAPAQIKCRAELQDGKITAINDLNVQSQNLALAGGHLMFSGQGVLTGAEISQVKINDTAGALTFAAGPGGQLQFTVKGPFFDASHFLVHQKNQPPYNGPPIAATIDADQMRTRDGYVLKNAKVFVDLDRQGLVNRIDVNAVAGTGVLSLNLDPQPNGRSILKLQAADAGATLAAFNVYENIVGGTITIDGQSVDAQHPRDIAGTAQIADFHVIKAPVLARMLSAISPANLPQLLNSSEGLAFAKLQSNFVWSIRPNGDMYVLSDGRTTGNSLGLTFSGAVDKEKDAFDVRGDIVPLSGVNGLIGHIPVVNILTGGKALFAATYTVSGPVSNPSVDVNPLAVLAPGILRRILFQD